MRQIASAVKREIRSGGIYAIIEDMKEMADPAIKQDQVYTYGDYRKWPDDERWELIEGTA